MRIAKRVVPALAGAALLSAPGAALAQGNPTQSAYGPIVPSHLCTHSGSSGANGTSTSGSSGSACNQTLPFTGVDLVPLVALGAGLLGTGAVMRRRSSSSR